jgi:hypothetical protein
MAELLSMAPSFDPTSILDAFDALSIIDGLSLPDCVVHWLACLLPPGEKPGMCLACNIMRGRFATFAFRRGLPYTRRLVSYGDLRVHIRALLSPSCSPAVDSAAAAMMALKEMVDAKLFNSVQYVNKPLGDLNAIFWSSVVIVDDRSFGPCVAKTKQISNEMAAELALVWANANVKVDRTARFSVVATSLAAVDLAQSVALNALAHKHDALLNSLDSLRVKRLLLDGLDKRKMANHSWDGSVLVRGDYYLFSPSAVFALCEAAFARKVPVREFALLVLNYMCQGRSFNSIMRVLEALPFCEPHSLIGAHVPRISETSLAAEVGLQIPFPSSGTLRRLLDSVASKAVVFPTVTPFDGVNIIKHYMVVRGRFDDLCALRFPPVSNVGCYSIVGYDGTLQLPITSDYTFLPVRLRDDRVEFAYWNTVVAGASCEMAVRLMEDVSFAHVFPFVATGVLTGGEFSSGCFAEKLSSTRKDGWRLMGPSSEADCDVSTLSDLRAFTLAPGTPCVVTGSWSPDCSMASESLGRSRNSVRIQRLRAAGCLPSQQKTNLASMVASARTNSVLFPTVSFDGRVQFYIVVAGDHSANWALRHVPLSGRSPGSVHGFSDTLSFPLSRDYTFFPVKPWVDGGLHLQFLPAVAPVTGRSCEFALWIMENLSDHFDGCLQAAFTGALEGFTCSMIADKKLACSLAGLLLCGPPEADVAGLAPADIPVLGFRPTVTFSLVPSPLLPPSNSAAVSIAYVQTAAALEESVRHAIRTVAQNLSGAVFVTFKRNNQGYPSLSTAAAEYWMAVAGDFSALCPFNYIPTVVTPSGCRIVGWAATNVLFDMPGGVYTLLPVTIASIGGFTVELRSWTSFPSSRVAELALYALANTVGVYPAVLVGQIDPITTDVTMDDVLVYSSRYAAISTTGWGSAGPNHAGLATPPTVPIDHTTALLYPPSTVLYLGGDVLGQVYASEGRVLSEIRALRHDLSLDADLGVARMLPEPLSRSARRRRNRRLSAQLVPSRTAPPRVMRTLQRQPSRTVGFAASARAQSPVLETALVSRRNSMPARQTVLRYVPENDTVPFISRRTYRDTQIDMPPQMASLMRVGRTATETLAQSLIDPFAVSACIPDGAKGSACFTSLYTYNLRTGAGGACALAFQASPNSWSYLDSVSANPTFTFPPANAWSAYPRLATLTSTYAKWRPVSMGMRVSFKTASNFDQGNCVLAEFPGTIPASQMNGQTSGDPIAYTQVFQSVGLAQAQDSMLLTWRPEDDEDQGTYKNFGANTTLAQAGGLPWLFVGVDGAAPNTLICSVDVICNYEGYTSNAILQMGTQSQSKPEAGWFENSMRVIGGIGQIMTVAAALKARKTL